MRPLILDELRSLLELEIDRPLRSVQGRETFHHRTRDGEGVVVKRSKPGARPGGRREHEALVRLGDLDFPVPETLGFASGPLGSVVVMERVAHVETARERAAHPHSVVRRAILARIADLLARLHVAGFRHRDFYAHHLLLRTGTDELVLIDVGRAGRAPMPRRRWFVKDVGALIHSLPARVTEREQLRFVAQYLDARSIDSPRARRSFARAAFAKARRIGRHVPRDERSDVERR